MDNDITYLDPNDDSLDIVEAVKSKRIHYVSIAAPGMTIAAGLVECVAGYIIPRRNRLFSQVNRAQETGTLLPRHHITLLPAASVSYSGMDTSIHQQGGYSETEIVAHINEALKAHQQYASCDALYFDFRHVAPDEPLYLKCLEQCLAETELNADTKVTTWGAHL